MRVLFFSHQSEFMYGGEVCTLAYMKELKKKGVEVFFAAPNGPYLEEAKKIATVFPISSKQFRRSFSSLLQIPKLFWKTNREIEKIVRENQIDIIHYTSLKAMAYQLLFPKAVPIIWHHHDILPQRWDNNLWLKALGSRADLILVPSDASNRALKSVGLESVVTLYNGFSDADWIRKSTRNPEDPFRVGMVGEISERKGADRWANIVLSISQKHQNVEFRVIGEGLSDLAFSENIKESLKGYPVEFLGRRSDMKEQYSHLDAILVLSRQDPLPTVIIEAGFSGVPAVATKVGGIPEMIESGETGFLVETDDEIVQALQSLLDTEKWAKVSESVFHRMRKKFSIEALTIKLILQYERLKKEKNSN